MPGLSCVELADRRAGDSLLDLKLFGWIGGLDRKDLDADHFVPCRNVEAVVARVDVRFPIEPAHRLEWWQQDSVVFEFGPLSLELLGRPRAK